MPDEPDELPPDKTAQTAPSLPRADFRAGRGALVPVPATP
jgi:hypothetical protein